MSFGAAEAALRDTRCYATGDGHRRVRDGGRGGERNYELDGGRGDGRGDEHDGKRGGERGGETTARAADVRDDSSPTSSALG